MVTERNNTRQVIPQGDRPNGRTRPGELGPDGRIGPSGITRLRGGAGAELRLGLRYF